jgi:alkylation response protein AidB-like acyl-CoA dehydrogenase
MLAGRALDVEKLEITAVTFGIAQAAVEEAWQYAQERTQFGKPICAHQAIRHKLVTARTRLEACRLMLYQAAELAQAGRPCAIESSMAKLFVADTGVEIGVACQQILGAYGLSDAYDMERNVRPAGDADRGRIVRHAAQHPGSALAIAFLSAHLARALQCASSARRIAGRRQGARCGPGAGRSFTGHRALRKDGAEQAAASLRRAPSARPRRRRRTGRD